MVGLDMGSTSYLSKSKSGGYRAKSGSSGGSDKEMNGKLRRPKIRRPTKLTDYGLKRIPDYTELAYKEAVSKLRYFLSGNYVPSVRSYGGSASIKNLDESDGDLDKKYALSPASYNTPLESKHRPRLTAKYSTLYADSLNNTFTPQHNTTAPTPAPAPMSDMTGGTNPDVINFIQKQEEYIEQLERESQYCRDELNNLLGKVKEVISENEHLHEAQKNKLISRMFHSYAGSETDELDDLGDSTGLDSDNKVTPSKARKTRARSSKLEGPNIVFESRIAELEAQLTQARIDLKKIQEENNENKRKLASGLVDSTCLDGFKRQIDNLQRDKSSLEAQISKLKLSLESRDGDYRRGNDVVEQQLREERNNLEQEIRRLKDDLVKERSKVRDLAGEGARRAIQERSAAEQRYNAHFDELQHDLAAQYDNVAKLQLDLERQRREENDLKRELSMKNAAIDELKMELKNKTSSLQADLAQAHAEKASVDEELASARLAIERHQRQAKHETNRLNSEIQSLRQRLDRADADLVHSRRENLRLAEQISNLEKELNMKNLTPLSPEKKTGKELSTMLESMENKHAKTVAELESMIQSQNSLMEKLTGECRLLTDKLDDANRRHKQELGTLQRQVDSLGRSLQTPQNAPSTTAQPPHAPLRLSRNIPQSPVARSGHPRVDTAGDADTRDQSDIRKERDQSALGLNRPGPGLNIPAPGLNIPAPGQNIPTPVQNIPTPDINLPAPSLNRQDSRHSVTKEEPQLPENKFTKQIEDDVEIKDRDDGEKPDGQYESEYANYDPNYTTDVDNSQYQSEHQQEYDGNVDQEQYQQSNAPDNSHFETGQTEVPYEESPVELQDYNNQGYDQQQYDQQGFVDGQYGNYEQYPQQYADPNAQYDGQYEQYATDPNYQQDPNFEAAQYNQTYEEPTQPTPEQTDADSKRSNTPNEKLTSQS